jgi:transcriptional regulator with XRE-family HTH domain
MAKKSPLAERLRMLRAKARVTQETIGDYVGVSQSAVGTWERGESEPLTSQIPKLCEFFGVSADMLLGLVPFDVGAIAPRRTEPRKRADARGAG